LPRILATSSIDLKDFSPSIVALTTLFGLLVPMDLVRISLIQPSHKTGAEPNQPAITPVPATAGISNTLPEPNLPRTFR